MSVVIVSQLEKRSRIFEDIFCLPRRTTQACCRHGKEDNTGRRKMDRKDGTEFKLVDYKGKTKTALVKECIP